MKTLLEYCKDYILDHIDGHEGRHVYGSDFCMDITEGPNMDGTLTYSVSEAKEYMQEWLDDCADYWEFEKSCFGENLHNPFDNPEAYMVCMVIEGCNSILSGCPLIEKHWNDKFTLTPKAIKTIRKYVEQFDKDKLF